MKKALPDFNGRAWVMWGGRRRCLQAANGYPYPEGISLDGLMESLKLLPEGITELGCHPGLADDLNSMYSSERMKEVKVLCDPRIRATIEDERIELCSFHGLAVEHLVR